MTCFYLIYYVSEIPCKYVCFLAAVYIFESHFAWLGFHLLLLFFKEYLLVQLFCIAIVYSLCTLLSLSHSSLCSPSPSLSFYLLLIATAAFTKCNLIMATFGFVSARLLLPFSLPLSPSSASFASLAKGLASS